MAKGNVLYARGNPASAWRVVARFADPDLRNAAAYAVSPQGDKLILTSPKRLAFATVLRDSLEAGRTGAEVAALASFNKALELNPRATDADRAAAAAIERKISGQP